LLRERELRPSLVITEAASERAGGRPARSSSTRIKHTHAAAHTHSQGTCSANRRPPDSHTHTYTQGLGGCDAYLRWPNHSQKLAAQTTTYVRKVSSENQFFDEARRPFLASLGPFTDIRRRRLVLITFPLLLFPSEQQGIFQLDPVFFSFARGCVGGGKNYSRISLPFPGGHTHTHTRGPFPAGIYKEAVGARTLVFPFVITVSIRAARKI
jgi:hypothetical protein